MKKTAALFTALFLSLACLLSAASAAPALYRVTGEDGGECYLFGTIHVGLEEDGQTMGNVYLALRECGALWTEVELSALTGVSPELLVQAARYLLPWNESLSGRLGEETAEELSARLGMPKALLDRYTPAWAAAYLESLTAQEAGLSADFGTEHFLAAMLPKCEAENRGLETVKEQMDTALSFSDAYMKASIREYLDDPDGMREGILSLHAMWADGDEAGLTEYIAALASSGDRDARDAYERLFARRNAAFARACLEEMAAGRRVMIAVGCGHLYGEDGVIRLLEEAGCRVDRVH